MDMLKRVGAISAGALCAAQVFACGVCVEDKMAATYDHEVVQAALTQQKFVVFCEITGPVQPDQLRKAAARVAGIDPRTLRASVEPAAVSFVVDPKLQTPEAAVAQLQSDIGASVNLTLIKTLAR